VSAARISYVPDTDTVTALQYGDEGATTQLAGHEPEAVATTIVTMYEQLRGRLAAVSRASRDAVALQVAHQGLQNTYDFYAEKPVLPFDTLARVRYQELRRQRLRGNPGSQDLQIAAIVLAQGAILVTSNVCHFSQVAGLRIVSWRS
jgi:tRNA(fMet)-specific endonuclease VapC